MDEPVLIVRYGVPNKYDHAPYGSKCTVILNDLDHATYIQTSHDENEPLWVPEAEYRQKALYTA